MKTLRLLRHLHVLRVEAGDVLVYRLPPNIGNVSLAMRTELREMFQAAFPGVRVVVLDSGDLSVVRATALDGHGPTDAAASSKEQPSDQGIQKQSSEGRKEPS